MSSRLPARIDRATFDRILQRAAELQAASRDIGDGLSEEEVLALGTEVGIPSHLLKQALLEERTRVVPVGPQGVIDRWVAPADFQAERVVQGTPEHIAAALTQWLDKHEHFIVQRATVGRVTYEPLDSFAGAMRKLKRVFDGSRSRPYQEHTELLTAVITPLEDGFCHVSLNATLRKSRNSYVAGATVLGVGGVVATIGLLALVSIPAGQLLALLPAAGGLGGATLTARAFRPIASRAQLGLERALDELERRPALGSGTPGASPRGHDLARNVGQVVKELTREVRKALEEK